MKGFSRITFGSDDDEPQQVACSKCGKFACFCLHDLTTASNVVAKAESKKRKMHETEQDDAPDVLITTSVKKKKHKKDNGKDKSKKSKRRKEKKKKDKDKKKKKKKTKDGWV